MNDKERKAKIEMIEGTLADHEMDGKVILWGSGDEVYEYADAILGIAFDCDCAIVYSRDKLIDCIVRQMTGEDSSEEDKYQDAVDHYEYNFLRTIPYMPEDKVRPIMVDEVMF